jgi:CPA2 family monovalent cation:H+ antiporter-2
VTQLLAAGTAGPPGFLAELVALVAGAAVIGYLCARARIVPIVGFLVAGALIGPHALGLVRDQELVDAAAEVGVILLLFTVGIEFSLQRLARLVRAVLLGGGVQVLLSVLLTLGVLVAFGVSWQVGLYTGLLVSLSSTAIVMRLLSVRGETTTEHGRLGLSFLVFQDLAVIGMVLVVPVLAGDQGSPSDLALAFLRAGAIVAVVLVVARRIMPRLLEAVARACSPEIFLLTVIAICFGTAYATSLAGVSVSLGAFLAGLIVSESEHSEHAFGEILPLQIIFSATFFVSVGMLLDVGFVVSHLPLLLAAIGLVLAVKLVSAYVATRLLGVAGGTATVVTLLLVQVGEFSFVLERVGRSEGLFPAGLGQDGAQVFVAATVLLMAATPWLHGLGVRLGARRGGRRLLTRVDGASVDDATGPARRGHVVISGYGDAARVVGAELAGAGVPFTVITLNPDGAAEAESLGYDVVRGDSTKQHILRQAGVPAARAVIVADDDETMTHRIATLARLANPDALLVVRPLGRIDLADLAEAGVDKVVEPLRASEQQLSRSLLAELTAPVSAPTSVDVTRIWQLPLAPTGACPHAEAARAVLPDAPGCADCLRTGGTWVHLRLCMSCGHVGCCDSSPNRHARAHFDGSGHPIIRSAEPGDDWGWCYLDELLLQPGGGDPADAAERPSP